MRYPAPGWSTDGSRLRTSSRPCNVSILEHRAPIDPDHLAPIRVTWLREGANCHSQSSWAVGDQRREGELCERRREQNTRRFIVTIPVDDPDEVGALQVELDRLVALVRRLEGRLGRPEHGELAASLRSCRSTVREIESRFGEIRSLERERDELLDRLLVVESALQSTSESRDQAVRLLAEMRDVSTSSQQFRIWFVPDDPSSEEAQGSGWREATSRFARGRQGVYRRASGARPGLGENR